MSRIVLYTIGNFTIDDIVLWPSGQNWIGQPGGNVLFSALGARLWLERVGILARVGNDYPTERLPEIKARGICLGLHQVECPTLHDWALYEAGGARQFINHLNSGSNTEQTLAADEIAPEHLDGEAYHLAPVPTHQQAAFVAKLKRPGRLLSLDPHESWIRGHEAEIDRMLADVDVFLPSEVEARLLYGRHAPAEAAREFARHGPRAVVIKLGAEGSLLYDAAEDRLIHVPVYPADAVDPTGAGDAYCGGFLAGYLLTRNVLCAAVYGTVSASYIVEAIGALSTRQPTREERTARLTVVVERVRQSNPNIILGEEQWITVI